MEEQEKVEIPVSQNEPISRKKIILLLVFLALILVSSVVLYYYGKNKLHYTYEGKNGKYNFDVVTDAGITAHVINVFAGNNQGYRFPLRYGPKQMESFIVEPGIKENLLGDSKGKTKKILYIAQDPSLSDKTESLSVLSILEINRITGTADYSIYRLPTDTAVTRETERSKELGLPLITCVNATDSTGVLIMELGDETKAYIENRCVILKAKNGEELLKLSDKVAYHLLGVF